MVDFLEYYRDAVSNKPMHFIVGPQGSGTNLLCKLLRQTFSMSVCQDRSLIAKAALAVHKSPGQSMVKKQLRHVHRCLFPGFLRKKLVQKHYHRQNDHYDGIDSYFNKIDVSNANEFGYLFYAYHAHNTQKHFMAVKSDDLWEILDDLPHVFPNRKYIFLVRDCRDNALSIVNKDFGPRTIYAASWYVRRELERYSKEKNQNKDDSVTVHYEDILQNPIKVSEAIATALDLEPVPEWRRNVAELQVHRDNYNKWTQLSERELSISETVLREQLEHFGYSIASKQWRELSWMESALDAIHNCAMRIPPGIAARAKTAMSR